MRRTNGLEPMNMDLNRRIHVTTLLVNPVSCQRLVTALLAEQGAEWVDAKIYLNMSPVPTVPRNNTRT